MRVPQVSERIKEAPAQALRGVFAGIGQLLLITDKLRHKTPAHEDVRRARTPETAAAITDAPVTSPAGSRPDTATAARPAAAEPAAGQAVTTGPAASAPAAAAGPLAEPAAAAPVAEAALATEAAPAKPAAAKRTAAKPAAAKPPAAKAAAAKPATKPASARRATAKPAAGPEGAEGAEAPKPPKRQSARNFDKTGNVRLLADESDSAAVAEPIAAEPIATPEPIATFEPTVVAEPVTAPEPVIVSEVAAPEPVDAPMAAPPLPNYDALTVASLRARLRNLDVAQVRQLAEYERAHAGRAGLLGMYERRIAKLEAEA